MRMLSWATSARLSGWVCAEGHRTGPGTEERFTCWEHVRAMSDKEEGVVGDEDQATKKKREKEEDVDIILRQLVVRDMLGNIDRENFDEELAKADVRKVLDDLEIRRGDTWWWTIVADFRRDLETKLIDIRDPSKWPWHDDWQDMDMFYYYPKLKAIPQAEQDIKNLANTIKKHQAKARRDVKEKKGTEEAAKAADGKKTAFVMILYTTTL